MADEGAVLNSSVQMLEMGGKAIYYTGKEAVHVIMAIYKLMETLRLAQWRGKADMKTLMDIKGDNLAFMEVSSEDRKTLKDIEKDMKREGILFSRLPDLNVKDGKTQFAFSAEDAALMKVYLSKYAEKVKSGKASAEIRIISAAEYARTGYEDNWVTRPELKELENNAKEELEKETARETKNPDDRRGKRPRERRQSRKGEGWDREGATTVTINKKMFGEGIYKKPGYFISRIPLTDNYCEIPETDMRRLNDNTVVAYIYPDKQYPVKDKNGNPIMDKNGKPIDKIIGKALVESYDDKTKRKEVIKDDPVTAVQEMEKLHKAETMEVVEREIKPEHVIAISESGTVICQVPELEGKAMIIPSSAVMNYQREGGIRAFFEPEKQYFVVDKINPDKAASIDGRQMSGLFRIDDPVTRAKTLENISKAVKERGVDLRKALGGDGMTLEDFLTENAPNLTRKGGKKL